VATEVNITGWYSGEDREFAFGPFSDDDGAQIDVAGEDFSWVLRRSFEDHLGTTRLETALAMPAKTTADDITIEGVFDEVEASNTQRVVVRVNRADTISLAIGDYVHELAKTTAGEWKVFAGGTAPLTGAAHDVTD
jgi:hypothetical protein